MRECLIKNKKNMPIFSMLRPFLDVSYIGRQVYGEIIYQIRI